MQRTCQRPPHIRRKLAFTAENTVLSAGFSTVAHVSCAGTNDISLHAIPSLDRTHLEHGCNARAVASHLRAQSTALPPLSSGPTAIAGHLRRSTATRLDTTHASSIPLLPCTRTSFARPMTHDNTWYPCDHVSARGFVQGPPRDSPRANLERRDMSSLAVAQLHQVSPMRSAAAKHRLICVLRSIYTMNAVAH